MSDLNYTEVLEAHEIKIPYVKEVISDRMAHVIGRNRYEASEVKLLRKLMRPRDRVLELGAGVGVVSTCAAQIARDPSQVLSIEAEDVGGGEAERTGDVLATDVENVVGREVNVVDRSGRIQGGLSDRTDTASEGSHGTDDAVAGGMMRDRFAPDRVLLVSER